MRLIEKIHDSLHKGVFVFAGGGVGMLSDLLAVPGASKTVLEALVPYSSDSMTEWLGFRPDKSCDEATAIAMARKAYGRARELGGNFGFAVTASLRTLDPKKGDERAWICFADRHGAQRSVYVYFDKSEGDRAKQEDTLSGTSKGFLWDCLDAK